MESRKNILSLRCKYAEEIFESLITFQYLSKNHNLKY